MRNRQDGQSSSDEDNDERAPLVARNPPPPPPLPQRPPPPAVPSPRQRPQVHHAPPPPPPRPQPSPQRRPSQQQNNGGIGLPPPPPFPPAPVQGPPLPPPSYPPPPPPPPPPAISASDWILRLRHPGKGVLRIHIYKGVTAYLLSRCIVQATDFSEDSVVGLFGYNNGMFVSLEELISCSQSATPEEASMLQKQLYSLNIPRPLPQPPWWQDWRIILATVGFIFALIWQHAPLILHLISSIPVIVEEVWEQICYYLPLFYHNLVTKPLKDTYRHGPAVFGGWEGGDLATICARMTYGDREFWERNYKDCKTMYAAKESAFLFIGRPLIFLVLLMIMVWILRQWLWYRALQNHERYQDRDMIQTYRAIQTLFRQINRMARVANGDRGRRPQQGRDGYDNGPHY